MELLSQGRVGRDFDCVTARGRCRLVQTGMRRNILLLSRSHALRSLLKPLRGPDVRLLETADGLAALFACASQPVDLFVIDRETPGMDCQRLAEKVAQAFPALPVVAVSASEAGDVPARVLEALRAGPLRKRPGSENSAIQAIPAQRQA